MQYIQFLLKGEYQRLSCNQYKQQYPPLIYLTIYIYICVNRPNIHRHIGVVFAHHETGEYQPDRHGRSLSAQVARSGNHDEQPRLSQRVRLLQG